MATYGEYQEDTAQALTKLLASETLIPTEPEAIESMLLSRNILLDDARNRLVLYGANVRTRHSPALGRTEQGPVGVLANALDQMPASGTRDTPGGLSPLDALSRKPDNLTAHCWREAASNHLLATHQLATSTDLDDWVKDDGSLWHLVEDSANVVEAIAVLDHDLAEVGLLKATATPSDVDQLRSQISYLAKSASWYTTNPGADFATSSHTPDLTDQGVQLISSPEQLATAQRRLAGYVRPINPNNSVEEAREPRITATEAQRFMRGQTNVLNRLADAADRTPGATQQAAGYRDLARQLAATDRDVKALVDLQPTPSRPHITGQLNELQSRVITFARDGKLRDLSPAEHSDILTASRAACAEGARALRYEGQRPESNLRIQRLVGEHPIGIHHHGKLSDQLTDIINDGPGAAWTRPAWSPNYSAQRGALRETLNNTPTSWPPQHPSPRGRDAFGR